MTAIYRTAPLRTHTANSGDCRMADRRAKPNRSRNAADPYPVEIGGYLVVRNRRLWSSGEKDLVQDGFLHCLQAPPTRRLLSKMEEIILRCQLMRCDALERVCLPPPALDALWWSPRASHPVPQPLEDAAAPSSLVLARRVELGANLAPFQATVGSRGQITHAVLGFKPLLFE